jgi:hypothetical protein
MPKLPTRSPRPTARRHKVAHAGKTLVRAWPLISLFRNTIGFARLGPLALPALFGAGVWKLLKRRKRKAQQAAMPTDPFVAPAPSAPSRAFTGNGGGDRPAPDPSAPAPGDGGQQTGTLPQSDEHAPSRPQDDEVPKTDPAAPDSARAPAQATREDS